MRDSSYEVVLRAQARLGEGPCWDARRQVMHWVDIQGRRVHTFDPATGRDDAVQFDQMVGFISLTEAKGEYVVGLEGGLARFWPESGKREWIARPEAGIPGNRFNDGKCDPVGRLIAGTMDRKLTPGKGALYSLTADGEIRKLLSGLSVSNGLAWSPEGSSLYFIDSPTRQVVAYGYDLESGALSAPKVVVSLSDLPGAPDGMATDAEGMLWVGIWDGGCVTRWDPQSGRLAAKIPLPAMRITSCAFGGPDLTDLYLTSAAPDGGAEPSAADAEAGSLFRIQAPAPGLPVARFGAALTSGR